eukprot:6229570-Karenia_brevis.AAC.1
MLKKTKLAKLAMVLGVHLTTDCKVTDSHIHSHVGHPWNHVVDRSCDQYGVSWYRFTSSLPVSVFCHGGLFDSWMHHDGAMEWSVVAAIPYLNASLGSLIGDGSM